jgi:SAM-dependent methyltransferase
MPDKELLDRIYGKYYRSYPSCATPEETERRIDEFFAAFSKFPSSGSALEIGSYDGGLLNVLKGKGFQVLGCDPNSSAAGHAKKAYGIDTVQDYFPSELFEDRQFDLVVSRLLLEHIFAPQTLWVELNRVVKKGGRIAHEVPNCHYVFEAGLPFFLIEHTSFFTAGSLKRLGESAGYEVNELQVTPGFLRIMATKTREIDGLSLGWLGKEDSIAYDLALAQAYAKQFNENIDRVNVYLNEARARQLGIAVYGTGYFFTNLLGFTSLDLGETLFACDSNPAKWGIMVPGLKESVQPPERISVREIGLVIIATQNYEGVLLRLKEYLDLGGNALYFSPQPTLVHPSLV